MIHRLAMSLLVGLKNGFSSIVSYYRDDYDPVRQDPLTKAYNRAEFERRYRKDDRISLILFDIDDFKKINDQHGHDVGDSVLREVACRIRQNIGDRVYRIGGEEFAILVHAPLEEAEAIAIRLREAISRILVDGGIRVTVSVGVGQRLGEEDAETCFRRVDTALYEAKHRGKNRVETSRISTRMLLRGA